VLAMLAKRLCKDVKVFWIVLIEIVVCWVRGHGQECFSREGVIFRRPQSENFLAGMFKPLEAISTNCTRVSGMEDLIFNLPFFSPSFSARYHVNLCISFSLVLTIAVTMFRAWYKL
jgi:hypothetical protein